MQSLHWREQLRAEFGAEATPVLEMVDALREDLAQPARADTDLRLFITAQEDQREMLRRLRLVPLALRLLLLLGGVSRYAFDIAARAPGLFFPIVAERLYHQVWGRRLMAEQLRKQLENEARSQEPASPLEVLAIFKKRHMLRIILGDISQELGFESVVQEISDLATVLIQQSLVLACEALASRAVPGIDLRNPPFVVMAMGKLGARELNYSSDIDLIFIYAPFEGPGIPDAHEFWQKLGAELIRLLEQMTANGQMFRVDMRLRPEGDRGELALSLRETIDYYYSIGRPWERQALIKARPVAGDLGLGAQLVEELRPWIYPIDPQWEDLEDARSMRRRIEERAEASNVKTGAGGIRDIEFLVQYFQLVYGGRIPELRQSATLPTLRLLADRSIIPRSDARELEASYLWLRMVEHRLQMWEDRQEHELPADDAQRLLLALRCGFGGAQALGQFDRRQLQTRSRVRELVARHFLGVTPEFEALMALVVQGEADEALAGRLLGPYGFTDISKASALLRSLAVEPFFVLSRNRTERKLVSILPGMLEQIARSPDPLQTLENFTRIVSAVGGRATFYDLLGDQPAVLTLFVDLAGWATFLITLFQEFPGLPDDVVDSLNQARRRPHQFINYARALVHGIRDVAPPLAYLKARETATIAIRDLERGDAHTVAEHLSFLAEAVLTVTLNRTVQERARRHGIPVEGGRPARFAVLGLGKLGGRELSYASDMDVIFVCDPGGRCSRGPGEPLQGDVFWTRVAQDLMQTMAEGRLYELDPRLRPYGEQSELVANTLALGIYWGQPRDLWERMAMLRVAHLAGDPRLGEEACRMILTPALGAALPANAGAEVRTMRKRLEDSVAGRDHLKRGPGGYVDHEFIAQFCSLGLTQQELPVPCATDAMLMRLGRIGRIPTAAADELVDGLRQLRFVESRVRLAVGRAVSSIPTEARAREELARRCSYTSLQAMDQALLQARETARSWFERIIPS